MNRRNFILTGIGATAVAAAATAGVDITKPAPIECELDVVEREITALYKKRWALQDKARWYRIRHIDVDAAATVKPYKSDEIAGGVTCDTFLDAIKQQPETELMLVSKAVSIEMLKFGGMDDMLRRMVYTFYDLPVIVRRELSGDTIRLVQSSPAQIYEVNFC